MPTFLNHTADDVNLPELGLSVKAGEAVEVSDAKGNPDDESVADRLRGHPHFDEVTSNPDWTPVATEAQTTEEVTD